MPVTLTRRITPPRVIASDKWSVIREGYQRGLLEGLYYTCGYYGLLYHYIT